MDGDWNQASPKLPAGVASEIAAGELRAATSRQRANGFYHALAEATAGNATAGAKPEPAAKSAFVFDPILAAPNIALEGFMSGGSTRRDVAATELPDLAELAASAAEELVAATERLKAIDGEIEALTKRRPELETELAGNEQDAANLAVAAARALLAGDKEKREKISVQRGRHEADARTAREAIAILDRRLETLRVDRVRCVELADYWRGTVGDLQVLTLMPDIAAKLAELGALLAPLDPSRRATVQGHLGGIVTGRSGNELGAYLGSIGARARQRVQPPAGPAERVFHLPADTVVELRRTVSYEDTANSTRTLPAGWAGPVPAHVAARIVQLEAGRLSELPNRVEIKALTTLELQGGGIIPQGHLAMLRREDALELVRECRAELTGTFEGTTPINIVRGPTLELGYIAPPEEPGAGGAQRNRENEA